MTTTATIETPVGRVIRHAYEDVYPRRLVEQGADNTGPALEARLARIRTRGGWTPGQPWCAAWITTVVTDVFPGAVPLTAGCSELAAYAKRKGVLLDAPAVGALHVIASGDPSHPYHHTGFVVDIAQQRTENGRIYGLHCLDGNTNAGNPPSRNGFGVFERYGDPNGPDVVNGRAGHGRVFRLGVDRFIHWAELLKLGA